MSRSYVGAVGPKCCAMAKRDGCLSLSAETAWSRSHSKRVIQRRLSFRSYLRDRRNPEQVQGDYGRGDKPQQCAQERVELKSQAQPEVEHDDSRAWAAILTLLAIIAQRFYQFQGGRWKSTTPCPRAPTRGVPW